MSDIDTRLQARTSEQRVKSDPALVAGGVTIAFLSTVFRIHRSRVAKLLADCPVKKYQAFASNRSQNLYDLAEAAKYLVEPDVDIEELLSKIKREDLPPAISTAYWDAQLKRQRFEENAGQLWRTETIATAIGGMFQSIKFTIQLWADTIERQTGLSEEQREALNGMTDQLQADIFKSLEENAANSFTQTQLSELEAMLDAARNGPTLPAPEVEEEEDDIDDLI